MLKQLIGIQDDLVRNCGSMYSVHACVDRWFTGGGGTSSAYDLFVHSEGNWTWKPLVWKQS